jgi:hypothetical protein
MGRGGDGTAELYGPRDDGSAPVWAGLGERNHDYDPGWDYEVVEVSAENLNVLAAKAAAERAFAETGVAFELHFVTGIDDMGRYIDGTASYPVIILSMDTFNKMLDPEQAIYDTIRHELQHARQDADGGAYDEDDAEHGWR